jgi:chloramphenicol 3-O phosphotransferase
MIGLARRQFARIHQGVRYDFEVDTSLATPLECAERIKARFGL